MLRDQQRQHVPFAKRLARFLDALVDPLQKILPIVLIGLGIGLVNVLPPKVTRPLFSSAEERAALSQALHYPLVDGVVYMLASPECKACSELGKRLHDRSIRVEYLLVGESKVAAELYARSKAIWGDKELPKVIVGLDGVEPTFESVLYVLGLPIEPPAQAVASNQ